MNKKPVIRMCVVCREKDSKRQLTRLVRTAEGILLDPTGKVNGRGAYLCDQAQCWQRAADSEVLAKALRTTLTAVDRERLRQGRVL
jgi:hypothetical protein